MPAPDDRLTRLLKLAALTLLALALTYVVVLFLGKILTVVVVLVGAVFLAYLLYPPVLWLQRHRFPRWLAISCVFLALILIIGGIGAFVGPRLGADARALAQQFPSIVAQVRNAIVNTHASILQAVPLESRESAVNFINDAAGQLQHLAGAMAGRALTILLNVFTVVTGAIIVPFLAFYILLDLDRLREGAVGMFPGRYRDEILSVLRDMDRVVGGFIRGQVIVAAFVAVTSSIWLAILHVKFALLIGIFAGVSDIIPYVGAIVGAVAALIVALFNQGVWWALLVLAGFVAIYEVEGHVVTPIVVGGRVGLPPLMIIVAILIGAELGGIVGMFVSVPVAAIIKVLWVRLMHPKVVTSPAQLQEPIVPAPAEQLEPSIVIAEK